MTSRVIAICGGSEWTPPQAGDCLGWFTAAAISAGDISAGKVTTWRDQSGAGNDLAATVAAPYGATAWNNARPGVTFDGSGQLYTNTGTLGTFLTSSRVSIFITVDCGASASYKTWSSWRRNDLSQWTSFYVNNPSGNMTYDLNGNPVNGTTSTLGRKRICWTSDGTNVRSFVDGVPDVNTTLSGTIAMQTFIMGTDVLGSGRASGVIADLAIYSTDKAAYVAQYLHYSRVAYGG